MLSSLFYIPELSWEARDSGLLGLVAAFTMLLGPNRYTSQDIRKLIPAMLKI